MAAVVLQSNHSGLRKMPLPHHSHCMTMTISHPSAITVSPAQNSKSQRDYLVGQVTSVPCLPWDRGGEDENLVPLPAIDDQGSPGQHKMGDSPVGRTGC